MPTLSRCRWNFEWIKLPFLHQSTLNNPQRQSVKHFCKFIKNQKLKSLIYISIQTLNSVLCRSLFGSNYSFESSEVSLYNLCTPGFGKFIPFFLADPLMLRQIGQEASVNCHLQVSTDLWGSMGFKSGLWLGHSRTVRDLSCRLGCMLWVIVVLKGHPSLRSRVIWSRFSSRTSVFGCIHPSLNSESACPCR